MVYAQAIVPMALTDGTTLVLGLEHRHILWSSNPIGPSNTVTVGSLRMTLLSTVSTDCSSSTHIEPFVPILETSLAGSSHSNIPNIRFGGTRTPDCCLRVTMSLVGALEWILWGVVVKFIY